MCTCEVYRGSVLVINITLNELLIRDEGCMRVRVLCMCVCVCVCVGEGGGALLGPVGGY